MFSSICRAISGGVFLVECFELAAGNRREELLPVRQAKGNADPGSEEQRELPLRCLPSKPAGDAELGGSRGKVARRRPACASRRAAESSPILGFVS